MSANAISLSMVGASLSAMSLPLHRRARERSRDPAAPCSRSREMDRREFLTAAAAPLVLGVVPSAFARRSGGLPLALVTADLESSIVAVELPSGRVYRRLQTPAGPRSIESIGGTGAIVAHTSSGRVSLVDSTLGVHDDPGAFRGAALLRGLRRPALRLCHRLGAPGAGDRRPARAPSRAARSGWRSGAASLPRRARSPAVGRARQQERGDRDRRPRPSARASGDRPHPTTVPGARRRL